MNEIHPSVSAVGLEMDTATTALTQRAQAPANLASQAGHDLRGSASRAAAPARPTPLDAEVEESMLLAR